MKDGEMGLLALAVVGGYLHWSKTEDWWSKVTFPFGPMTPAGVKSDGDYSNSPYKLGSDGKWANEASIYAPKKGGIHNALKPIARSLQREKPLEMLRDGDKSQQSRMMSLMSDEDKAINPRTLNDKQRVELAAKYGYYENGKHPDTFRG